MGVPVSTQTKSARIVERWGKFSRTMSAGLDFLLCPGFFETISGTVSLRIQQLRVQCETKTRDNVFLRIQVSIQYHIIPERIEDAYYKLTDTKAQIEAYVFDVIRAEVPKMTLDESFVRKEELSARLQAQLIEQMTQFGYAIIATPVTDIDPDGAVKQAMNEINRNERLKQAAKEEGEAKKILQVKEAEAIAEKIRIEASAEADAKHLAGVGLARQRQAIIDGLQESVKCFQEGIPNVETGSVMDLVLLTQYFDTLTDVSRASRTSTLFIPTGPAAVNALAGQIRQGVLEGTIPARNHANHGTFPPKADAEMGLAPSAPN